MLKNELLLLLAALLILPLSTQAQRIAKLEIGKKETYTVAGNLLQVDTLILHDKGTIRFAEGQQHQLEVQHAYIGEGCTITAAGANGKPGSLGRNGEDGTDAGSLRIKMHLVKLGSLALDTRGGTGGDGYRGKKGRMWREETFTRQQPDGKGGYTTVTYTEMIDGTPGEPGTSPGLGGNGADVMFYYSTSGFKPNFNRDDAPHSITVLYQAGQTGEEGHDGYSYSNFSEHMGISYTAPTTDRSNGNVRITKIVAN